MKYINIIAAFLMSLLAITHAAETGSLSEFSRVMFDRGHLVVTTHAAGIQFVGKIGTAGASQVLARNSEIELPLNEVSVLSDRHISLTFTPLTKKRGFIVKRTTDLRSLRRGLKEEEFSILIAPNGEVSYTIVTLKGAPSK